MVTTTRSRIRTAALALGFLGIPVPGPVAQETAESFRIRIATERPEAIYQLGETVRFRIEIADPSGRLADAGSVDYELSNDGYAVFESESLPLTGKPILVEGTLERPGFLRCDVRFREPGAGGGLIRAVAAAGLAPDEISPSREVPPDFSAFWAEQKARLAEIPLESEMTGFNSPGREDGEAVEVFDTQVRCEGGWPVSGYFARPKGAEPESLPAVLWTHGAGVRSADPGQAIFGAREGFLSFDINAHGIQNGESAEFYQELASVGRLKDYRTQGRENRDGMYFRGMFLRLVRAIDFLTSQPEWDGRVMAVIGHSQGGAQAIAAGGLDERVTFIGAGVPAMCDHTGMVRKRISGWPKLVPILPDGKPDPNVAEVSRYFDAVNFAAQCHADAIVSIGFVDRVCPPTSCYAAYNQLRGEKQVLNEPAMGHAAPEAIREAFVAALKDHVEARRKSGSD